MEPKPRPILDLSSQCACGAVRITFRGKVKAMFMCSCEDCQKATGTGHATIVVADPDDVTITGDTTSYSRAANSGASYTRWFCPTCGTPISGLSSRAPKLLAMPVGLFGRDTEWFVPSQMIFARSHRDWDMIAADVPQYATYRDKGEA